jgi:poly-beta-hydroxyalkanoate depolymerase
MEGGELAHKLWADDGSDPIMFPFLDLYTSIMDLDAAFFRENIRRIYHEDALARGPFFANDELVDLSVITVRGIGELECTRRCSGNPRSLGQRKSSMRCAAGSNSQRCKTGGAGRCDRELFEGHRAREVAEVLEVTV